MNKDIKKIKELLSTNKEIYEKYNIKKIGIFGSYLSGKNKKSSDLDLLIEFNETIGLFEFVHLANELQKLLKVKIDLTTLNALKPYIKEKILREVYWVERS
jgi:predicted nucleotidyltransferase